MNTYAFFLSMFPPIIVSCIWVSIYFVIWAKRLLGKPDKSLRFLLVAGIAVSFLGLAFEKSITFYEIIVRAADSRFIDSLSEWEIGASTLAKIAIWAGATMHLHALWKAFYQGRSYWAEFTFSSILLFCASYLILVTWWML